jgi:hypothetical protein
MLAISLPILDTSSSAGYSAYYCQSKEWIKGAFLHGINHVDVMGYLDDQEWFYL